MECETRSLSESKTSILIEWSQHMKGAPCMTPAQVPKKRYQQDLVAWLDDTVIQLKERRFEDIDLDRLIEEIEGLAGRDRRELKNRLDILLNHLLKRLYVNLPEDYRGWELTIREQRKQIKTLLEQSPSLQNHLLEVFPVCWQTALSEAREDYSDVSFPDQWPECAEIDALLNQKFWENQG